MKKTEGAIAVVVVLLLVVLLGLLFSAITVNTMGENSGELLLGLDAIMTSLGELFRTIFNALGLGL